MAELLRGRLDSFRLPTLLQAIESELLDATLTVVGAGSVRLGRGRVVAARCPPIDGVDALFELFLSAGDFQVDDAPAEALPPLGDTLGLIVEGCRVADDWARHRTAIFEVTGAAPPRLAKVWPMLDGRRSFERALRGLAAGRAPFVAPLENALHDGVLRIVGHAEPAPAVDVDFDEAMRRGREALRSRAIADAIDWFGEGLRLRPDDRAAQQNLRVAQQLSAGGGARAVSFRS